jgi:hypothetical protein
MNIPRSRVVDVRLSKDNEISFEFEDNTKSVLRIDQDCCERNYFVVEEKDLKKLIGFVIHSIEEIGDREDVDSDEGFTEFYMITYQKLCIKYDDEKMLEFNRECESSIYYKGHLIFVNE